MPVYKAVIVYPGDRNDDSMKDAYSTQQEEMDPVILTDVKLKQETLTLKKSQSFHGNNLVNPLKECYQDPVANAFLL